MIGFDHVFHSLNSPPLTDTPRVSCRSAFVTWRASSLLGDPVYAAPWLKSVTVIGIPRFTMRSQDIQQTTLNHRINGGRARQCSKTAIGFCRAKSHHRHRPLVSLFYVFREPTLSNTRYCASRFSQPQDFKAVSP